MKRSLDSSDSLGALISICPSTDPTEEHSPGDNHGYSREFGSMLEGLEEEGAMEEAGFVREKKRRLSVEQVKALEKRFEVENKLEPERKTKLAQELGLQPRQIAVWFQNRRARWKTKQLEKDYGILKASFDSLQDDFHSLQQENDSLKQKTRELKSKLGEENTESGVSIKEEEEAVAKAAMPVATMMASESDSSAVLNSPNSTSNDDGSLITHQLMMPASSSFGLNCSSTSSPPSITYFNLSESSRGDVLPFVKMEEHDFLGEEGCNFFPEDEAPSLHWYCSPDDQWTS